jgi:hypothetical protein
METPVVKTIVSGGGPVVWETMMSVEWKQSDNDKLKDAIDPGVNDQLSGTNDPGYK